MSLESIEKDYLHNSKKIYVMHNRDDVILDDGVMDFFARVFGDRAKIYPRGGHCGNMQYVDNVSPHAAHHGESAVLVMWIFTVAAWPQVLASQPVSRAAADVRFLADRLAAARHPSWSETRSTSRCSLADRVLGRDVKYKADEIWDPLEVLT